MKEKLYETKYGKVPVGTKVFFAMENPTMWGGDTKGTLIYENKKWLINTANSGKIGIGGYLEAYPGSIQPY